MAAKKKITTAELKKLLKETYKLNPLEPIPASTAKKMASCSKYRPTAAR